MSHAHSRPRRREAPATRAKRLAALVESYGFAKLCPPPRVIDADEATFLAIGDPRLFTAPLRVVGGAMVSSIDTCRTRRRMYAARVWLARRLARRALDAGLAAAWRGTARENLYGFRLYTKSLRQARGGR